MRITLASTDHRTLDRTLVRLVTHIRLAGGKIFGPIPKARQCHDHQRTLTFGGHEIRVAEALAKFHLPASVDVRVETQVL